MRDPILNARLDVLELELKLTNDPVAWKQKLCLQDFLFYDEYMDREWLGFTTMVQEEVRAQLMALTRIREKLRLIELKEDAATTQILVQAWHDYNGAFNRSQEMFHEFLEFIGGLTFRDKKFDSEICDVADELIRSWANVALTNPSITVPTAKDALTRTLGRMVRVRFPEWTVWTLPFTAHEYGHVVLNESVKITQLVPKEIEKWADTDAEMKKLPADPLALSVVTTRVQGRANSHVKVFLADAFATHIMGPAYACAAILLRFDPSGLGSGEPSNDTKRAYVVLEILRRMNTACGQNYQFVIDYLDREWNATLTRVNAHKVDADDEKRLKAFVDGWAEFEARFPSPAKYPCTGPDGWAVATEWAQHWLNQLPAVPLQNPTNISYSSKLRDVLNAAWICRIESPNQNKPLDIGDIANIATAARSLCGEISLKVKEQWKKDRAKKLRVRGLR